MTQIQGRSTLYLTLIKQYSILVLVGICLRARKVVVKAEETGRGPNPRYVVVHQLPGKPRALYQFYGGRGACVDQAHPVAPARRNVGAAAGVVAVFTGDDLAVNKGVIHVVTLIYVMITVINVTRNAVFGPKPNFQRPTPKAAEANPVPS
jgi:hypothetical protein